MRETKAKQIDGSTREIEYRFTYLLNGFVAYIAIEDLERLRSLPDVKNIYEIEQSRFMLDNSIDYTLGTQFNISDRRLATYGANQELVPLTSPGHAETPRVTALDGYEGQNINLAIIDSGVDWRHPMFGGIGQQTPLPRVSGNQASTSDNRKVIYYYAMSSPGDPTDDFGHGTLVASTAAGFAVDGNTPAIPGFGLGRDNTGVGPTISGSRYHGTAPQARIMGYKVCGPAPQCAGDSALSMEDAASPYTFVRSATTGPIPVPKPIADVINLSLGDTAGSANAASSVAANNAALNGTIVVASAGNAGPGAGTIGAPSAATLAISVAASLDPGSVAGADVLTNSQIPTDPCSGAGTRPAMCDTATAPTAPATATENGTASNANTADTPIGLKIFPVAGGGQLLNGSQSAHYVYVDLRDNPAVVPTSVGNRVALAEFSGTFASAANVLASQPTPPTAIILITATESATAAAVVKGIPTYTISVANGTFLKQQLLASARQSKARYRSNRFGRRQTSRLTLIHRQWQVFHRAVRTIIRTRISVKSNRT